MGLLYNYFRDYDPATGRYIESDPIGLRGGVSTYGYVSGNPLVAFDPYGLLGYRGGGPQGPESYTYQGPGRKLTGCEKRFLGNYFPGDLLSKITVYEGFSSSQGVGDAIWNYTLIGDALTGNTTYAQTHGNNIYVRRDVPDAVDQSLQASYGIGLLGHEIAHSSQNAMYGRVGFYGKYLFDWVTNGRGYSGIPAERGAFRLERTIQNDLHKQGPGCGCDP